MHPLTARMRAFTLIETVIVMAIIAIASIVSFASYSGMRATKQLDQASHQTAASLRQAQNYALTGRTDSTSQDNCRYNVSLSGSTITLINYYPSTGGCNSSGTVATYTLLNGVAFASAEIIGFELPRARVLYYNGASMVDLTTSRLITLSKAGQSVYLCVYATGRIEERGTNASCP